MMVHYLSKKKKICKLETFDIHQWSLWEEKDSITNKMEDTNGDIYS